MGFQMQIRSILRFSCSILVKWFVHLERALEKLNAPSREEYNPQVLAVLL